jgi:hypothetical protein
MALVNKKHVTDLMEMYAGQAGVSRDDFSSVLAEDIINVKIDEFMRRSGLLQGKSTITTADEDGDGSIDQEYELPAGVSRVYLVHFDNYRINKIRFDDVSGLAGKRS